MIACFENHDIPFDFLSGSSALFGAVFRILHFYPRFSGLNSVFYPRLLVLNWVEKRGQQGLIECNPFVSQSKDQV